MHIFDNLGVSLIFSVFSPVVTTALSLYIVLDIIFLTKTDLLVLRLIRSVIGIAQFNIISH